ncbi:tyrosine-type recombinase/integrase [Nitrobacter sp. TKz-YC01]|uniref:tyrosine-type recombinase/integrase n=1 Tax=Nitrobacter sp. TKz-YC01 TaxID=3398703 RepID=UPI003A101183
MTKPSLLEPSFADALSAIEQSTELAPQMRSQWASALRQIAKALDKPMETLPARLTAMRFNLERLHHATVGANAKTLANQKSNVKAALRWFGKEHDVAPRGMPLTAAWAALRNSIGDYGRKARLSGFMRYCSGCGIEPAAVNEAALSQYFAYRMQTTSLATNLAARRSIARAWNVCVGHSAVWPQRKLAEPALQAADGPAWNDFPPGLQKDIDYYLASLQKIRKGTNGKRYRPCSATTIRTRRAELVAMVRKAVKIGIPIERFTSLTALVHPDVAGPVLDAYWRDNGDEPKIFTIELASKLVGLGRYLSLDQDAIDRLEDLRATLEEHRQAGLTEKNLAVVRKVLTPGVWRSVVNLPAQLMRDARASLPYAPVKAALTAQIAVAISILCFAPIRLGNLVAIRIDQNLIKPGGPGSSFWLSFPHYDVKNRVSLDFTFDDELTELIDEYIHQYRPHLIRGANSDFLFPGASGGPKTANMFSGQITDRIEEVTGLRLTVHQFRHAAAAIYLRHNPGAYEVVKRLLGHRNMQTTINFYCGLETVQANQDFGKMIRRQMRFEEDVA